MLKLLIQLIYGAGSDPKFVITSCKRLLYVRTSLNEKGDNRDELNSWAGTGSCLC